LPVKAYSFSFARLGVLLFTRIAFFKCLGFDVKITIEK
jgi:hypothetical protein